MASSLNTQTNREIRYIQRMERKRVEQQNIDRSIRAANRNNISSTTSSTINKDVSTEVSNEIATLSKKKRTVNTRTSNSGVSFSSYFW